MHIEPAGQTENRRLGFIPGGDQDDSDREVLSERDKNKQLAMQRRKKEYRAARAA